MSAARICTTAFLGSLMLAACGGGGGGGNASVTPTLSGTVMAGPFISGQICAYSLSAGTKGGSLGCADINPLTSEYSLPIANYTGEVLLEIAGNARHDDEATATDDVTGTLIPDGTLRSIVTINANSGTIAAPVTPLTEAAVRAAGFLSRQAVNDAATVIRDNLGLGATVNLMATKPLLVPTTGDQLAYREALRALSQYMQTGFLPTQMSEFVDHLVLAHPTTAFQSAFQAELTTGLSGDCSLTGGALACTVDSSQGGGSVVCQPNDYQCVHTANTPIKTARRVDILEVHLKNSESTCVMPLVTNYRAYDPSQPHAVRVSPETAGGGYVEQQRLLQVSQLSQYQETLPVVSPWDQDVELHIPSTLWNTCTVSSQTGTANQFAAAIADLDGLVVSCDSQCSSSKPFVTHRINQSIVVAPQPGELIADYRPSPKEILLISTDRAVITLRSTLTTNLDVVAPGSAYAPGSRSGYFLAIVKYAGECDFESPSSTPCGSISYVRGRMTAEVSSASQISLQAMTRDGTDYYSPLVTIVPQGWLRAGSVLGGNGPGTWNLFPQPPDYLTYPFSLSDAGTGLGILSDEIPMNDVLNSPSLQLLSVLTSDGDFPTFSNAVFVISENFGMTENSISGSAVIGGNAASNNIIDPCGAPFHCFESEFTGSVATRFEFELQ